MHPLADMPDVLPEDAALVAQAQAGDARAFERLYRMHVGRVYALCLHLSADEHAAARLTQDAFVRAWKKLGQFEGTGAFGGWLHRLTLHVVLNDRRTTKRREARVRPTDDLTLYDRPAATPTPGLAIDLRAALAALPERARHVLLLHDLEGYRHADIAEQLGIATGTSKAHLHRARRLLRDLLGR